MASFMQYEIPGGHVLRGEAFLADGRAAFLLTFEHVTDDSGEIVGSHLTGMTVMLNNCTIRDPEFAQRLYREATGRLA